MDYERDENVERSTTFEVIWLTLRIYGSAYLCALCTYIAIRPRFPLIYNFCNSITKYQNALAVDHHGHVKWIWKNFQHADEEVLDNCGLTAAVLLRFLKLGLKIAGIGIFNSFFLIPVNIYGCDDESDQCNSIMDGVERIGLGNLVEGSLSFLATTVAAYIMFGSTMYFIYHEFAWFAAARHKFLSKPRPDNYSVYVAHIPPQFRGDIALLHYFKEVFEDVLEAKIALDIYGLERKVANREKVVEQLEHAFNKRDRDNREPTHIHTTGEIIQSIPFYTAKLEKLNNKISEIITSIEHAKESEKRRFVLKMGESTFTFSSGTTGFETSTHPVLQTLDEDDEMEGLLEENELGDNYDGDTDAPIKHIRQSSLEKNDFIDKYKNNSFETPVRTIRRRSLEENDDCRNNIETELLETPPNVPVEVVASNSKEEEHQRDISELPVDVMEGYAHEINGTWSAEAFNQGYNGKSLIVDTITSTDNSNSITEKNDGLNDSGNNHELNENDLNPQLTISQINLSEFKNNPCYQLLFSNIDSDIQKNIDTDDPGDDHIDDEKKNHHQYVESNQRSSPTSIEAKQKPYNSLNTDSVGEDAKNSQKTHEDNENENDNPSFLFHDRRSNMLTENKSNRSLMISDDDKNDCSTSLPQRSSSRRSLGLAGSDDSTSFYVLDEDANRSFLSDLRKELKKDTSCKSLLSDSSQTNNDIQVIVDASLLRGNAGITDTSRTSSRHNRSVTFDTINTMVSSASKRTKSSIHKSLVMTADGMKKSAHIIQDGVLKSANVLQKGMKVSASALGDGMKKSVFVVHDGVKKTVYVVQDGAKKSAVIMQEGVKKSALAMQDTVKKSMDGMKHVGAKSIKLATELIKGSDDGKVRDGGFVTFTSLSAKAQCVQMLHHAKPFTFYVTDAPMPRDIFWNNVGLTHEKQQIGFIVAQALTVGLCLCWTFPVTFVSSLSEIDSLKQTIPSLEQAIDNNPWLQPVLAQLNPILMVLLKLILPVILSKFCEREGHISRSTLSASLLTKLSIFLIVQVFFVPAISGSVFAKLPEIIDDWRQIMKLLATSIPGQVKSFIQYVLVNVFIQSGLEFLRIPKVAKAFVRSKVGPNLSEKERNKVYMGLQPLTTPEQFDFSLPFAEIVLYCMILLVYSCIAPIMSYVMFIVFLILLVTYRNQFIFVYSAHFDSGGELWARLMRILCVALIIAQLTLIGIMSIKNSSLSSSLLVPLCWFTLFFFLYLEQQHYKVTNHLPSTICRKVDARNHGKLDMSFLKDQYIQPALKQKILLPDNFQDEERATSTATNS